MEKLKIPVSSIIADEIAGFILVEKETVKDCDVDFRDGKRRVNAAKAPRKSRKATPADACASSAGGSECDWYGSPWSHLMIAVKQWHFF